MAEQQDVTGQRQVPGRQQVAGRDPDLGAAYAGIAVGALAVAGASAVAWRWAARPPVRTLTIGPGWLTYRGAAPRR